MDNVVLTSATQINPDSGHPLTSEPTSSTIAALVDTPLEPVVDQSNVDGNFQTHFDVNYQAHDVALATAKANGHTHEHSNGFKLGDHHQMEIDDGYEHPDKIKSCCSMLNKLFLALAIACFALFLCSIAFIIANLDGLNDKYHRVGLTRQLPSYQINDPFTTTEKLLNEPYFNLTHPNPDGIMVIVSSRGASIHDILIPYVDKEGRRQYRSIVLKSNDENAFGAIRFGFDDEVNSMNLTNQLPLNYPLMNFHRENWSMYADRTRPSRVRLVQGFIEVIYEFSSTNNKEFLMTTIVNAPLNDQIIADPTNNIYFNLRGYGDLTTHDFNMSLSNPINIKTSEQMQENPLLKEQSVDRLNNVNNYFYKLNRAGIGKNYIATLFEKETMTSLNIFSDHTGVIIDPLNVGLLSNKENVIGNMSGIRISPRQSPVYQPMSIYGPILIVHPSQGIHTTWWQFEY